MFNIITQQCGGRVKKFTSYTLQYRPMQSAFGGCVTIYQSMRHTSGTPQRLFLLYDMERSMCKLSSNTHCFFFFLLFNGEVFLDCINVNMERIYLHGVNG